MQSVSVQGESSRRRDLVAAVLALWPEQGSGELSARSLALAAGVNASSIYYHFNDLEHLYEVAQTEALTLAAQWADGWRAKLDGVDGMPLQAFGSLTALLIDDWCEGARALAFAWRECQLLAARNPRFAPPSDAWNALWREFWSDICARFGAAGSAEATTLFFDGESLLHMMRWSRPIDRAALEESARIWIGWLDGQLPEPVPWRVHARVCARAADRTTTIPEGNLQLIAMAAARLLAQKGAGAVTHRAIAAEAGLTLGVVSHNCKRTDDLLKLAYSEIYVQLTGGLPDRSDLQAPDKGAQPDLSRMLAIDELVLAVARGRVGGDLVGLLRYLRGSTSVHTVRERVTCTEAQSVALAAVYSSIAMGYWRSTARAKGADAGARYDRFLDKLFAVYA